MFGWKAKAAPEEPTYEPEPEEYEDEMPTWADGSYGPHNPVSRIFGRLPGDAEGEARVMVSQ